MTCWICWRAELSWQPPVPAAALAVTGGLAARAAATMLAPAARFRILRRRRFTSDLPSSHLISSSCCTATRAQEMGILSAANSRLGLEALAVIGTSTGAGTGIWYRFFAYGR